MKENGDQEILTCLRLTPMKSQVLSRIGLLITSLNYDVQSVRRLSKTHKTARTFLPHPREK
jgi:hypothetical protein